MSITRSVSRAAQYSLLPGRGKGGLHVADLLLPVSVCLWAIGLSRTNVRVLGPFGLLADLPLIFYAGVALLVASAATELAQFRPSTWRMAAHAVALVVMLYGTAPLLYPEPRYTWVYKTVAVVQYVNANGHLNEAIDIYQNWPGFFALAAWFTKLAGLGSPLAYAKWAQLFYELAALPLLYLIYDALRLTNRQRWAAILLYSASNWIGQDYFSPQATGTLLSLGIMAIAMRWLYVAELARVPVWHWLRTRRGRQGSAADESASPPARSSIAVIIAILLMYCVLTFTHELSPYIVAVQLSALAAVGALRPRWLPLALAGIAIGYLVPHFSFVSGNYRLTGPIGHFFKNVTPPSGHKGATPSERWIERCAAALSVGIWALAAVGAWLRRRAGQAALPLVLLAYSPVLVLVLQGYGHEGILRVFLFSLPWSAALGACALLPRLKEDRNADASNDHVPAPPRRPGVAQQAHVKSWNAARSRLIVLRIAIGLGVALSLFFPSFFGDDGINVMPQAEVVTLTSFLTHATPGTIYVAAGGAPLRDTARYNQFHIKDIFGKKHGVLGALPVGPEIADVVAIMAHKRHNPNKPAYLVVAPSMLAHSMAYQETPASSFRILLISLAHSPYWKLVRSRGGTVIYELLPTRSSTGTPSAQPAPGSLPPGATG